MEISATTAHVKAADLPLDRLLTNSQLSEQDKVGELSRQFEAVLLRKILADAQKTVFHSKYTDESTASGIYRDMITNQLADNISKSGTFGLAQSLNSQLTHQLHQDKS
jgi:Rod binding domain-containing protein